MDNLKTLISLWKWCVLVAEHYSKVVMTEDDFDALINSVSKNRDKYDKKKYGKFYDTTTNLLLDAISKDQREKVRNLENK